MGTTESNDVVIVAFIALAIVLIMVVAMTLIALKLRSEKRKQKAERLLEAAGFAVLKTAPAASEVLRGRDLGQQVSDAIWLVMGDAPVLVDERGKLVALHHPTTDIGLISDSLIEQTSDLAAGAKEAIQNLWSSVMKKVPGEIDPRQDYPRNAHGVIQYPKGDARRLFVLIAAIDELEKPTLTSLAEFTGWNKGSIDRDIPGIETQYGVVIEKSDAVFSIKDWGKLLNKNEVKKILRGA